MQCCLFPTSHRALTGEFQKKGKTKSPDERFFFPFLPDQQRGLILPASAFDRSLPGSEGKSWPYHDEYGRLFMTGDGIFPREETS